MEYWEFDRARHFAESKLNIYYNPVRNLGQRKEQQQIHSANSLASSAQNGFCKWNYRNRISCVLRRRSVPESKCRLHGEWPKCDDNYKCTCDSIAMTFAAVSSWWASNSYLDTANQVRHCKLNLVFLYKWYECLPRWPVIVAHKYRYRWQWPVTMYCPAMQHIVNVSVASSAMPSIERAYGDCRMKKFYKITRCDGFVQITVTLAHQCRCSQF